MACKTSFELHHHFPKLAEEAGFTFNTHRPRIHIDWNKIRLINIDSLVKERKFYIIEQHLNDILDCVFESEFDVRILDEGVLKIFRLAQLAVEYQQFCRHYLDRSVYVLREEVTSLAQQLDVCKKESRNKDDELRRLRKRSRHSFKTPLPYSNDNIAAMILKTLSHKGDILPTSLDDTVQYNKCNYCDKIFLNQLYLRSHISRRHGNVLESPQKDKSENIISNENLKLSTEVTELQSKIKEMEIIIANTTKQVNNHLSVVQEQNTGSSAHESSQPNELKKDINDADVSTNNEEYLLNKLEEWKKEEHANYNKEMDKLRYQIMETINTIKEKDNQNSVSVESNMIAQLHETIKQQGEQILTLKNELNDSRARMEKETSSRHKEYEAQVAFWSSRAETQSTQYELLLQKLNDVAKDGKESRTIAEAERERAEQLKTLLQESLNSKETENNQIPDMLDPEPKLDTPYKKKKPPKMQHLKSNKSNQEADRISLEKLHRKAQELLTMNSVTSTSSETSSVENINQNPDVNTDDIPTRLIKSDKMGNNDTASKTKVVENKTLKQQNSISHKTNKQNILINTNGSKLKKSREKKNNHSPKILNGKNGSSVLPPGSPMKLVRAKITEEVNSRLVSAGVDPLKPRLPRNVFQRQRMQLNQQHELKAKKSPIHDKVRHKLLTFLDSSTSSYKKEHAPISDYTSHTKSNAPFKNLTSVMSSVKSKALSLVKLNDSHKKDRKKSQKEDVAKRAMTLLETPPGSTSNSPKMSQPTPLKTYSTSHNVQYNEKINKPNQEMKPFPNKLKKSASPIKALRSSSPTSASEDSEESEHKYYSTSIQQSSKSVETLIKSPARRPSSAGPGYNHNVQKFTISDDNLLRTQSATNLAQYINNNGNSHKAPTSDLISKSQNNDNSSDDESLLDMPNKKGPLDDNVENIIKQTKSVLKNASSTSSLNKKKVLFDMDAIQMKSVSASPSQSLTERSEVNEKYELGLVNLDGEEWDISSIENEPLKNDTKIQNVTRTSPKITELKAKIESQLARRNETPSTALAGRVDLLGAGLMKAGSTGGSNTSLGSSILDESESVPVANHRTAVVKPKRSTTKEDSDIEISEFSIDGIVNKNGSF